VDYPWNWKIFWEASPDGRGTYLFTLIDGLQWTLMVALTAWALALLIGIVIGVMRTVPNRTVSTIAGLWVDLFRNIPLLVQVFLWYFVIPELLPEAIGTAIKRMPLPWGSFVPAVLGLALFTSARVAEQVRSGIQSIPRGQMMAAKALGLTTSQSYRYVLLPVAMRIILPPMTSEFMNTIKNSSVALTVGLIEVTAAARAMQEFSFQVFEAFTAATIIYVFLNLSVVALMRLLERNLAVPGVGFHAAKAGEGR
jgi:glutamate/aspartate transport system permease protein